MVTGVFHVPQSVNRNLMFLRMQPCVCANLIGGFIVPSILSYQLYLKTFTIQICLKNTI